MKKSSYLLFLFVVMVLSCLLCGLKGCNTQTKEAINSDTTEEETVATFSGPQPIKFDDKEPITLKLGEAKVIEVSDEDEKLLQFWTSSDDSIVSVDDGGRIDAKKIGTATITAKFSDKESNCKVTVEKADDVTDTDTFSTAITANTDILNQNINSSYTNPYAIYVNRKMNTVTVYTYDENGNYTGEQEVIYTEPVKAWGNISAAKGDSYAAGFGTMIDYDKVLCTETTDLDENAVVVNAAEYFSAVIENIFRHHGTAADFRQTGKLLRDISQVIFVRCHLPAPFTHSSDILTYPRILVKFGGVSA